MRQLKSLLRYSWVHPYGDPAQIFRIHLSIGYGPMGTSKGQECLKVKKMIGQHSPVNGNQRMIMMNLTENELSCLVNNHVIREGGNLQGINASCAE